LRMDVPMPNAPSSIPSPAPTRAPAPIRVLCVDDSQDITEQLGRCIAHQPDMESAGFLHTADNLRAELDRSRPDVVLLDLSMPGDDPLVVLGGLTDAARAAGRRTVRVIVFSGRSDQDAVDSAAQAGAWGYLSKDSEIPVILGAIRAAARGTDPFKVWR
jgi:DNA-binding NarL/FixJ family response regulator